MYRILGIIIIAVLIPISLFAQETVYLGVSGASFGRIYEDGFTDDGTRYIVSDAQRIDTYYVSLCKYISETGESLYGIAIETKEFLSKNGQMVFIRPQER